MEKKQIFEKIIKEVFLSKRMQNYLIDNYDILSDWDMSRIIGCSLLSIEKKYNYAMSLGLEDLACECGAALCNMKLQNDEIFYLKQMTRNDVYELIEKEKLMKIAPKYAKVQNLKECTEIIEDITCCLNSPLEDAIKPFFDFKNIMKYINLVSKDEGIEDEEYIASVMQEGREGCIDFNVGSFDYNYYFIVEKWRKNENINDYRLVYDYGDMELVGKYYIVNQKVVFYEKLNNGRKEIREKEFINDSADLNIPIPFEEGEMLSIKMKPFMDNKNVLIISKIGNDDCCSIMTFFIDEKGKGRIGALKHSYITEYHDWMHSVSPLYGITDKKPVLKEREKVLLDIQKELKKDLTYDEKKAIIKKWCEDV